MQLLIAYYDSQSLLPLLMEAYNISLMSNVIDEP
jgi:hypothetical protein